MKYLTKMGVMRAFDVGIDAFVKALNKELERDNAPEQASLTGLTRTDTNQGLVLRDLIAFYIGRYKANPLYGPKARPDVGGKAQGVLLRLLKTYNAGQVKRLIEVYLQLDDEWFKKQYHDLVTLEQKLQRVLHAATTGQKAAEMTGVDKARLEHAEQERGQLGDGT
jgi:hypothetical protein